MSETVLVAARLQHLVHDDKTRVKLANWLLCCGGDYTQSFDLVGLLHDVADVTSFREIQAQLVAHERRFQTDHQPVSEPSVTPVDPVHLLGLAKQIGLKCPECHERETRYKLVATRRADEGMTAHCSCRLCNHQWRISM